MASACCTTRTEVLCAGLACLDIELLGCTAPRTVESIAPFRAPRYSAGGGAAQAATALTALGLRTAAAYAAADDAHGRALVGMLGEAHVVAHPATADDGATPLAVLPVFEDGRRACFVSLGAAKTITQQALVPDALLHAQLRAFHFGYPHLLPLLQGAGFHTLLSRVRRLAPRAIISLDVNGADAPEGSVQVLRPALSHVDLLHANLEEACIISGLHDPTLAPRLDREAVLSLVEWFLREGVVTACITCGRDGVFAGSGSSARDQANGMPVAGVVVAAAAAAVHCRAFALPSGTALNTSGAGDAFAAGSLAGVMQTRVGAAASSFCLSLEDLTYVADAGLATAFNRLAGALEVGERRRGISDCRSEGHASRIDQLVSECLDRPRIEPRLALQ